MEISGRHFSVVAGCLILAGWLTTIGLPSEATAPEGGSLPSYLKSLPYTIEGWTGRDLPIDDHAFTILSKDADAWIVREYSKGEERVVLSMVTTLDQRKLFRVHIPDICLPAQGWSVKERSAQAVQLAPEQSIVATSLLAEKNGRNSQVLYWFTSNNRFVESKIYHRLLLVWDGVMGEQTPGTLIEVTAPLAGQDRKRTFSVQEGFLQHLAPFLPKAQV